MDTNNATRDAKGTGIARVHCYVAPGRTETCDRCSRDIRHVCLVTWKDGRSERFGIECINKILGGDTSLQTLFKKNQKLAEKYAHYLDVLSREPELMPRGSEYFGSGLFFIADDDGKDISLGRWCFHPVPDWDKNQGGDAYVQQMTQEVYRTAKLADVAKMVTAIKIEQARVEGFLKKALIKMQVAA